VSARTSVSGTAASSARAHRKITGPLVIATHNPGKLAEMGELLLPYGVQAVAAGALGLSEPEENGATFRENARHKAICAATASGLPAFADDSGLAVDALGGEPGIHSARWAGRDKDFRRAMEMVQEKLRARSAHAPPQRKAHFVSALCVAWPDRHVEEFEATVEGTLVWPPRGEQGFGYDPMFLPDGHARTFGEMPSREKHGLPPEGQGSSHQGFSHSALSHRARAFLKLADACLDAR
jgi:XTP/dITP diphosphohydrolase